MTKPLQPLTAAWFIGAMEPRADGTRALTPPEGSQRRDLAGTARIWIGAIFGTLIVLAVVGMLTAPMWAR